MNTNSASSSSSSSTLRAARERGKVEFERGNYEAALSSFREALASESYVPDVDRQLLLSNVVACRLKLGGEMQARAAVQDAKACIALNPSWSKGHVRLASAFIALGVDNSNDACNALQTAVRLDPHNRIARQMLVQELRRDHGTNAARSSTNSNELDQDEEDVGSRRDPPVNPNYVPPRANANRPDDQVPILDDSVTLQDRCYFYMQRAYHWYYSQNEDVRTALNVVLGLLVLYVAFGGRFGWECGGSSSTKLKGNYGDDNVYEKYRRQQQRQQEKSYQQQSPYNSNSNNQYGGGGVGYTTTSYGGVGGGSYSTTSYGGGGGGSELLYIAGMGAAIYAAHRLGISPWQVLMVMRMMNHRGGGGVMYGGGHGGFGRRRRW